MKTIILDVPPSGARIDLVLRPGKTNGQAVLVLPDEVEIATKATPQATRTSQSSVPREFISSNGFPPRSLTEQTILQIIREHGGSVRIRDTATGWNIYDEIAARLGVSIEARRRPTEGTGEAAWRPEVGFCRKNLEQRGDLQPTEQSGRGVWTLK